MHTDAFITELYSRAKVTKKSKIQIHTEKCTFGLGNVFFFFLMWFQLLTFHTNLVKERVLVYFTVKETGTQRVT